MQNFTLTTQMGRFWDKIKIWTSIIYFS